MAQPRLYLDQPILTGEAITIQGERAHYVSRVLRLSAGASVTVFGDGNGDYLATIVAVGRRRVELRIGEAHKTDVESPLSVCLYQGIARGERMDFVVQKATELGVARIAPVFTEFSVVKLGSERAKRRVEHWRRVAQSACEQCGRNRIPEIVTPQALPEVLRSTPWATTRLVLDPSGATKLADSSDVSARVELLIGPEGGLSPAETDAALGVGFRNVTLGPRVLRTETAAIAALSALQSRWGDF